MLSPTAKYFSDLNADRTKRSSNFSIKEVRYLIQLVDRKKEIIESKKSDRATSEEKVKAWREIEEEFNSVFDEYRSFRVLKTKYDNLKKNVKRKMRTNVSNLSILKIMQTSDNAVTNEPLSDLDYNLSEDESILHKSNASDVDMKPLSSINEEELDAAAEEYVFETLLLGDTQTSFPTAQQNTISTPRQEQTEQIAEKKKSTNTTTTSAAATVDVWEQVAHKKLIKLEAEIKVIEEEWRLKKQKLELEVEGVRLENRIKEENLKILEQKSQNNDNNSS